MELDPIVVLAYVSVSLNLITVIAAAVVYGVFWLRRRARQRQPRQPTPAQVNLSQPVFLRLYVPANRHSHPLQVAEGSSSHLA